MKPLSIRDLQKISGEAIGALDGPTAVTSGGRTVGVLVPMKLADRGRLATILAEAEMLSSGRSVAADDAALLAYGQVDPIDWSVDAVRDLTRPKA